MTTLAAAILAAQGSNGAGVGGGGDSRDKHHAGACLADKDVVMIAVIFKGRNYYSIILTLKAAIHGDHRLQPITFGGS